MLKRNNAVTVVTPKIGELGDEQIEFRLSTTNEFTRAKKGQNESCYPAACLAIISGARIQCHECGTDYGCGRNLTEHLFPYFPTKEDVVLNDEFDARFIEAFNAEPADISPIKAMRHSIKIVYANMSPAERISEQERSKLIFTVPELRSAYMSNLTDLLRMISDVVAKRVNRDPNTLAVRTFAGALMGVALSVIFTQTENPDLDTFTLMDEAFSYLEDGLPL